MHLLLWDKVCEQQNVQGLNCNQPLVNQLYDVFKFVLKRLDVALVDDEGLVDELDAKDLGNRNFHQETKIHE